MKKDSAVEAAERIFRNKRARRSELARLPFEKKIEILVELQRLARGIPKHADKPVWRI